MATIHQFAVHITIKKVYGSETELNNWLQSNPMLFVIEIEHFRYMSGHNEVQEGFLIYYKKP